jgi:hypothetical protein
MSESVAVSGDVSQEGTTHVSSNWRDNLPDEVKDWDEAKNSDSQEKFFQQMAAHRRMLGQSVRIPSADAGEEAMGDFYNKIQTKVDGLMKTPDPTNQEEMLSALKKLGLPDSADGYGALDVAEFDPNSESYAALKGMAHKAGLTKNQFKELAASIHSTDIEAKTQKSEALAADKAQLKGEWGEAFDQRMKLASNMAEKTGAPKALVESIAQGRVDSATAKWLYDLSQQLGGEIAQFRETQINVASNVEMEANIEEIMGNQDGPYWNPSHPSHKRTVDKVLEMRRKIHAG